MEGGKRQFESDSHCPSIVSPGLDAGLSQAGLSCWGTARDAVLDCGVFFCFFVAVFLIDGGGDGELGSAGAGAGAVALLRVEHTVSCLWCLPAQQRERSEITVSYSLSSLELVERPVVLCEVQTWGRRGSRNDDSQGQVSGSLWANLGSTASFGVCAERFVWSRERMEGENGGRDGGK